MRVKSDSLPSKPLAARIMRAHPVFEMACKKAGVVERDLFRWRRGECGASPAKVDTVLTKLGLHWWDVWNEDTVHEYMLQVVSYRREFKKDGKKRKRWVRVVTGTREYMSLGTDFYALRRIQGIMEPPVDLEEAA